MVLQGHKVLFVFILLMATVAANASPTVTTDKNIVCTANYTPDTPAVITLCSKVIEPIDSKLADIGRELLTPPAHSASSSSAQGNLVKTLPAGPTAMLMVLTGFLFVSLINDRNVWLTALAGILWAGQTGIQAFPKLAFRLCPKNHSQQKFSAEPEHIYYLESLNRLRSDIEGTRYIGLLRHLAGIPDSNTLIRNRHFTALISAKQNAQKLHGKAFSYHHKNKYTLQHAVILQQFILNSLFKCLAPKAEQSVYFSPAFIFIQLPRGPPNRT